MVGRADVWRMRMDATTNWAIGATAGVVSFGLGNPAVPHYVLYLAPLTTLCFLYLEARRLTFHRLWQDRVMSLERTLIRPAIDGADPKTGARELEALGRGLGTMVPTMPLRRAMARRLRRVYAFLFGVQLVAWALKLANHPTPADSASTFVERAHVGLATGEVVIGATIAAFLATVGFAVWFGRSSPGSPGSQDTGSIREEADGS